MDPTENLLQLKKLQQNVDIIDKTGSYGKKKVKDKKRKILSIIFFLLPELPAQCHRADNPES